MRGPVIVGGMGGSGTRALTRILMELRWFMAPRRNEQEDALDVAAFDYRWAPPFLNGAADVARMREEFDGEVLPRLLPGARWGWKHNPSVHLLPFYSERFGDLRFVHAIRDGRDVVATRSEGALVHTARLGRAVLDGDATPWDDAHPNRHGTASTAAGEREATPRRLAALWARTNMGASDFGERALGERYLRVRLEDLVSAPRRTVERIAAFLGAPDVPREAVQVVRRQQSVGAHVDHRPRPAALEEMSDALTRFGYRD